MTARTLDRWVAVLAAIVSQAVFLGAVGSMALALAHGLQIGRGNLIGSPALAANLLLVAQFPLLHSGLLSKRGRHYLPRWRGGSNGRKLDPTVYAAVAAAQLLATFWAWSPSGIVWHRPHGGLGVVQWCLFGGAWAFLLRALTDAGLALQTGAAGWLALWRGQPVDYGGMPERGLFRVCRQPIYLGFAMVLFAAPTWSPDMLLLACGWGLYCVVGPLHKEARWRARYPERFAAYRAAVPYLLPRFKR